MNGEDGGFKTEDGGKSNENKSNCRNKNSMRRI